MPYDVNIRTIPPYGLLNIRARPGARAQMCRILELELPSHPNTTEASPELLALWLGPDEWLLRMPDGDETRWQQALRNGVESNAAVTVVSDAHHIIEISGREARDILSQGTELDMHERCFGPRRCARIRFAKAQVILHRIDASYTYHLYVARSYERYLSLWLKSARGA